ncbi:MAG: GTPase Era [Gammaproteobacteria bacterium]|nr:GTPase Era [Gammaproteobacteria bacterium]
MSSQSTQHCGYVAIIGRPNVGKSTLLNAILGEKLSITSRKAQTTRHRILGVKTVGSVQTIYVDTPGRHFNTPHAINQAMNRTVDQVIDDVDLLIFVVDVRGWHEDDERILARLQQATIPIILVVNKVDLIKEKTRLLPILATLAEKFPFAAVVPLSARRSGHIGKLEKIVVSHLPPGPHFFPAQQRTDRSEGFLIAELVREAILKITSQEVPHAVAVTIDNFDDQEALLKLNATIWVERSGQKAILIGQGGEKLKKIGERTRKILEARYHKKAFLRLWVKVKANWRDDEAALRQFDII